MGSVKHTADVAAIGATLGSITTLLPPIAALLSIIWTGIRIYEWHKGRKTPD